MSYEPPSIVDLLFAETPASGPPIDLVFGAVEGGPSPAVGLDASPKFGAPAVLTTVVAVGFDVPQSFGTPTVSLRYLVEGIDVAPAFGTAAASSVHSAAGLDAEAFFGVPANVPTAVGFVASPLIGTPSASFSFTAAHIDVSPLFGLTTVLLAQAAAGLDTSPLFGTPAVLDDVTENAAGFDVGPVFGAPSVVHTEVATGLDAAPAFGAPAAALTLSATGLGASAQFGSPAGIWSQFGEAMGVDAGAVIGLPQASITTTSFGAAGFQVTQFGATTGSLRQRTYSYLVTTKFGEVQLRGWPRTVNARGARDGRLGIPSSVRSPRPPNWITRAEPIDPVTRFGRASIEFTPTDEVVQAYSERGTLDFGTAAILPYSWTAEVSGSSTTSFGTPKVRVYAAVTPLQVTAAFGVPATVSRQNASGTNTTALGTPLAGRSHTALSLYRATGWGRSNVTGVDLRLARGFSHHTPFGRARAYMRFNYPTTGARLTAFGAPAATGAHSTLHMAPTTRFGRGLMTRNPPC